MKVELEGHHVDITESMKSIASKKFKKFEKRYDRIDTVQITVKLERNSQCIDVKTRYLGNSVTASSSDKDFYKAIDQAAIKLDRALESRKGHIDVKGREKPLIVDSASEEPLDEEC